MFHSMGPFGEEEDAEVIDDVVDGQVVGGSQQAPPTQTPPKLTRDMVNGRSGIVVLKIDPNTQQAPVDITDDFLAAAVNQRSRTIALFIEVPFLAYLAITPKLPGLVRVGAAVLGVMRTLEVVERQAELEQYMNEIVA